MTLIKSISGIRGTVGGRPGDNLTPLDIVKFVSAYATWLKTGAGKKRAKIVLGRDARISGDMYAKLKLPCPVWGMMWLILVWRQLQPRRLPLPRNRLMEVLF